MQPTITPAPSSNKEVTQPPGLPAATLKPPTERARLVTVLKAYHQRFSEQASMVDYASERRLTNNARPILQDLTVGESWVRIDCSQSSIVFFENLLPARRVYPTPEEAAADKLKIIQVSFDGTSPHLAVLPGESLPPISVVTQAIWLRCFKGEAFLTVHRVLA